MDDDALSGPAAAAWFPFAAVAEMLPAAMNSALLRESGVTLVSLFALMHLRQAEGRRVRLSDLAACANSALPRMSRIVARLEADGLVERSDCADDKRGIDVTLTDAGARVAEQATVVHDRLVREWVVEVLTAEQLAQLEQISCALMAKLHPDSASPVDRQRVMAPS